MVVSDSTELPCALLFGDPVGHSVSPNMHNAAFAAIGFAGIYEARQVAAEQLAAAISGLRQAPYLGANVTVPHKVAALHQVDELSERAALIGAINTIVRRGDRLYGENTDAPGLLAALSETLGTVPYGLRIVLLGAGGAARGAAVALLSGGPASLSIYNRDAARAVHLAAELREVFGGRIRALEATEALVELAHADLLINATSAGLDGHSLPLTTIETRPGAAFYDMVYTPSPTPLMRMLQAQGARVADGLEMLVRQAAASFELWTGQNAPVEVMREAALTELRRRGVR